MFIFGGRNIKAKLWLRNFFKRKYKLIYTFFLLAFVFMMAGCGETKTVAVNTDGGYSVTDDKGTVSKFSKKPMRILTCTTALDEIVLGLVEPERMVAVNHILCDPTRSNIMHLAKRIPNRIQRSPSIETVLALKPDIVLAQEWVPYDNVLSWREMGIPVVVCKQSGNIDAIRHNVKLVAEAIGEKERGEKLLAKMEKELAELVKRIEKVPKEKKGKSIALVSVMPAYGGAGCIFDDICRYTDSINAKAVAGNKLGQTMTKEQFIACNPDYIFIPMYLDAPVKSEIYGADYYSDPSLSTVSAVQQGNVKAPWAHYIYNVSQDVVFGIQEAARMLYGEEFSQPYDRFLTVAN